MSIKEAKERTFPKYDFRKSKDIQQLPNMEPFIPFVDPGAGLPSEEAHLIRLQVFKRPTEQSEVERLRNQRIENAKEVYKLVPEGGVISA